MTLKELLGPDWIPQEEFAKLRNLELSTLAKERAKKPYQGPPFSKDGQQIFYSATGYREWLENRKKGEDEARQRRRR